MFVDSDVVDEGFEPHAERVVIHLFVGHVFGSNGLDLTNDVSSESSISDSLFRCRRLHNTHYLWGYCHDWKFNRERLYVNLNVSSNCGNFQPKSMDPARKKNKIL